MTAETAVRSGAGIPAPRRAFSLPEADEEYLDTNYPAWETIIDGATPWLVLGLAPISTGHPGGLMFEL